MLSESIRHTTDFYFSLWMVIRLSLCLLSLLYAAANIPEGGRGGVGQSCRIPVWCPPPPLPPAAAPILGPLPGIRPALDPDNGLHGHRVPRGLCHGRVPHEPRRVGVPLPQAIAPPPQPTPWCPEGGL